MALKTDGDTLTKELKMAAKVGRNFIFSPASSPEETFLALSKKKIPASELKAAKAQTKKKAYQGSATKVGPMLVFETPLPVSPALTIKLRAAVKAQTKYKGKLELKQNLGWEEGDFTEDEDEGEDSVDDTTVGDSPLAKIKLAVSARLKDALPTAPDEQRAQITKLVKGAKKFEAADNEAEAIKCYRAIAGLLANLPSGDAPDGGFDAQWKSATEIWQAATDRVDKQIEALTGVLKQMDDEELKQIAEFGLFAVTGNNRVPLMAAMRDVSSTTGADRAKAAKKAKGIVAKFAKHLGSDPRIKACDENPFGASVSIAKTLGAALKKLDTTLNAA